MDHISAQNPDESIMDMSILVVDDLSSNRQLLMDVLETSGFGKVQEAESAEAAFRSLGVGDSAMPSEPVDLVLMDVMMPGIDGIDACKRIKQSEDHDEIPVVMVTALAEIETLERAFEVGASDYITKPINQVELLARVKAALTMKQAMDQRKHRELELQRRERELLDVTRLLEETNSRLRHLSTLDSLTGIPNRRRMMEFVEQEWRRAARDGHWMAVIMIDVDFFKNYNDSSGHQAGDDCLWMVANCLKNGFNRPADMVGRYGGEEFIAVLPETPLEGAINVAESVRNNVHALHVAHPDSRTSPYITISLGVASCIPTNALDFSNLIATADRALFEAKSSGRNKAVSSDVDGDFKNMETPADDTVEFVAEQVPMGNAAKG